MELLDEFPDNCALSGRCWQNMQIDEGTHHVQHVVVAKHLLK